MSRQGAIFLTCEGEIFVHFGRQDRLLAGSRQVCTKGSPRHHHDSYENRAVAGAIVPSEFDSDVTMVVQEYRILRGA